MSEESRKRTRNFEAEQVEEVEQASFDRSKKTIRTPEQKRAEAERGKNKAHNMDPSDVKQMFETLMSEIRKNTSEIKKEMQEIRNAFKQKEEKWEKEREQLETRIGILEDKIEKEEKEKRRNNIVIKGLTNISDKDTTTDLEKFIEKELQVKVRLVKAYKLKSNKFETVIAEVESWTKKIEIMKNKSRLGGRKVYIDNDMTVEERKIQSEIRAIAKKERENGKRVTVGYQKAIIEGVRFRWNKKEGKMKTDEEEGHNSKNY